jgi:hypothetical protein
MEDFLEKDKGSNDQTGSRRTSIGSRGSSHSPSLDKAELFSFAPGNSLHTPESRHTITGSDRISHSQSGDSTAGEDKKLPQVDEFIASLHKIGK